VTIDYETTAASSALQWLSPEQTAGREYPYLFTQCQAIHARTLVPCQDEPSVKMTYSAVVNVPTWATCVMSAVSATENETATKNDDPTTTTTTWKQTVPISSYLLAMAVGQLEKRDLSERCAVWSEPTMVNFAAKEFEQTEECLCIAEELAGLPYVWGRYDILCLPPSFPYGGMENPVSQPQQCS
jgi:leukotriene-A4 hydrolase